MALSNFPKKWCFTQQARKLKMLVNILQSHFSLNSKKTFNMLYNYVWTSRLPNFRLIHSFLANTLPKNRTRWWHHFLRLRFWPFLNIAQKFFFNSESKRLQKYFFPKKQTFGNLASCDLGLTRPFTVVDFHGSRLQNGLVSYSTCKKWP